MAGSLSDNPRGRQAVQISSVFTGLALVIVILRLYTRFFLIRCVGIEDAGIALAMLCSIGLTIAIGVQAEYGMGRHTDTISDPDMVRFLRAFWSSLIVYYLCLGLTKASMLLQYRRIFPTKQFQIANWITMAVVIGYTIWTVFSSIFMCVPVRAFWTHEKATCLNQFAVWFTNAAINIITDFAIILLPIPVIQKLNLGKRQKIGLISIFAIGGFRGGSKALRTKDDFVLDVTKRSNNSSEDARDIQVITDIHIEVDGADGRRLSGWRTPASQANWSDNVSGKETQRENSTEMLVDEHVRASSR
ncbi:uncharacterized protein ALTATR162_LOCUS5122 [Alternaria atra]|uniref:Rhodopsin domain-containing protein n=1 Tax=Alternaria atra TaxID=119953 RepID=A0A8J2HZE0_9PLEO|nr:uncharacterized protein ALTATR162_LOCUS5122 [Alternaria atra]CAG5158523.1 unnamed protein product [Alternaria atra]